MTGMISGRRSQKRSRAPVCAGDLQLDERLIQIAENAVLGGEFVAASGSLLSQG